MLWIFQNFTAKFNDGEWWQQKQTNLQNNIYRAFPILIELLQKQTNWTLKIDGKCKNQIWTLNLKCNEKENEKTVAGC